MGAYLSSDISRQMLEILASVVRRDMLDVVDSAEFVGVLIDETLDVTSTEQMVVYYRLVGPTGKRQVMFAGIEPLPKGDAETIICGLLGRLSRDGVPLTKLMSFGSDGATVLTGHLTGVGRDWLGCVRF